jgi:general secretion pathway protein G
MNGSIRTRIAARRGLSLIEVLIVIAILLAIGGLVVVNLLPAKEGADINLQRVEFDTIGRAMSQFRLDVGRWPSEDEGLTVLWSRAGIEDEAEQSRWRGPYLENPIRNDKWGRPIQYRYPGEIRGEAYYDLISFGPDGQEGTEDDITNHDRLRGADGEVETDDEVRF